jgi:hypothetical protein
MQPFEPTTARRWLVALGTGAGMALGIAQAQTPAPAKPVAAASAPAGPQLTIRDIYDRLEAAGYREIREIEYSHGRYEVEARNAQGARVKLYVNAATGTVERARSRD